MVQYRYWTGTGTVIPVMVTVPLNSQIATLIFVGGSRVAESVAESVRSTRRPHLGLDAPIQVKQIISCSCLPCFGALAGQSWPFSQGLNVLNPPIIVTNCRVALS